VKDGESLVKRLVVLALVPPLTADLSRDFESHGDLVPAEAADEAQMLPVSSDDVRLAVDRRLGAALI
jgi:hypothetical protein